MKSLPLTLEQQPQRSLDTRRTRLERTFVETGDDRCPIAGIWLKIADADSTVDEPALVRPAMNIRPWRAFHLRPIWLCYSAS